MINFPCTCGHRFSFPDEEAGGMTQCPQCKRLVDIPIPGDLANFEEDGTVKMDIPFADEPEEDRMRELTRAYLPRRQDANGEDYDLRVTMEQIEAAGTEEIPLELKDEVKPGAPKYDPVTGELIRPMALKEDAYQKVIPLPPQVTLGYARPAEQEMEVPPWRIPLELFKVQNLAVMVGFFAMLMLAMFMWVAIGGGLFFAGFFVIFVYMVMMAHGSNVVEDIGHAGKDELPAPLRGVEFGEDIWKPFVNFAGAAMLCEAPGVILVQNGQWAAGYALLALGWFMFPAILLTLSTSGSVMNLRPDRVFSVIGHCGISYVFAVGLWVAATATFFVGHEIAVAWAMSLMKPFGFIKLPVPVWVAFALMVVGIYLFHWFCWRLGLLYRQHHEKFPWVLQQHVRSKKWQEYLNRRKPKYVPKPATAAAAPAAQVQPQQPTPVQLLPQQQPMRVQPVESINQRT
jgi:hypothetical protein